MENKDKKHFFEGFNFLTYNGQSFLVDKFSGFSKVVVDYRFVKGYIKITYSAEIYFSGNTMKLYEETFVNSYCDKGFLFKDNSKEFNFCYRLSNINAYDEFKKSGYKSKNKSDIIADYIKWFAENTNTEDTLSKLKTDIEYCFGFIEEHYNKEKVVC